MRKITLLTALIFLTGITSATIGTYTGETAKEGPQANFLVGFASEKPAQLELQIGEKEGLNFEYNNSILFEPANASKNVQYKGNRIPLEELIIKVESIDPNTEVYEIPVTLRAYDTGENQGQTSPKIVHEREYTFYYRTELSSDYGFEGDLIRPDQTTEEIEEEEADETLNLTEENTITEQNQTASQEGEQKSENRSRTTYMLIAGIMLVFGYVLKEAML